MSASAAVSEEMLLLAKRRSHLTYLKHIVEGNTNNNVVATLSHLPSSSSSSSTLSPIDASGYSLISSSSCLSNNSAASNSSRDLKVLRNSNDDQVKECTNDNSNKYDPSTSLMRKSKRKFKIVSKVDIAAELIAKTDQTDSSDSKSAIQDIKEELSSLPCEITSKEEEKYSIFLCNDMIYEILSFFSDYLFITERCVYISKQWYNVIRGNTFELHFDCYCSRLFPKLGYLKSITTVDISTTITNLEFISRFHNLKRLNLENKNITSFLSINVCSQLSQLKYLNLRRTNIHKFDYEYILILNNLKRLNTLDVSYCSFQSHQQYEAVSQLSQLTSLNLSHTYLQPSGLSYIVKMNRLSTLDISHNKIQYGDIVLLNKLTNLTNLNILGYEYRNIFNDLAIQFPKLVKLKIFHDWSESYPYSIANFKNLKFLGVRSSEMNLKRFEYMESLTYLDIFESCYRRSEISLLSRLKNLKILKANYNNLNDDSVEIIGNSLHNLTTLHLNRNNITDKGVKYISLLSKLTDLDIRNNEISRFEIFSLEEMSSLKKIWAGRGGTPYYIK